MRREVRSPTAGSVWSHVASVGQHVCRGAVLLVVECMKMELPVEAPCDGVVAWLRPSAETVEADDLVATIDAP